MACNAIIYRKKNFLLINITRFYYPQDPSLYRNLQRSKMIKRKNEYREMLRAKDYITVTTHYEIDHLSALSIIASLRQY